jgi:hypothetical protein
MAAPTLEDKIHEDKNLKIQMKFTYTKELMERIPVFL